MVRQRRTAEVLVDAAGWALPLECDADWDEMDHLEVLSRLPQQGRDFQAWFEAATDRWIIGEADDYAESFATFTGRVEGALRRAADRDGTGVVVTSGGPVSWVVAQLLGADTGTYRRLAAVVVNTGLTKLVTGRRGLTLVSFNEHAHLEAEPALLTYR